MKKLLCCAIVLMAMIACNQKEKEKEADGSSGTKTDTKALFEKNLAALKASITAFENEKIDDWAASVADTASWYPPAYGAGKTGKEDWKKTLAMYMADWDSLQLVNPNFLPGVDSTTMEFDGSVRYYGEWHGVHKSGVRTALNFYGSYDFNKDGKVSSGTEFFDVGGLMNAIKPK